MFFSISKAVEWLPDPLIWAGPLLVLAVVLRKRVALAAALALLAVLVPLVFASPPVSSSLERWAAGSVGDTLRPRVRYDAVILLSGTPEEGLSAAARLLQTGRARFLLYSGVLDAGEATRVVAEFRRRGIPDEQVAFESESRNTRENAVASARVVRERGWEQLVLVTGAIHARRALACFRRVGLTPDLMRVWVPGERPPDHLLPETGALTASTAVVHEVLGYLAYRVAGYVD